MTIHTLIGRLSRVLKMLLPDRSLNIFPPDFTLRRPIASLLNKRLKQNELCYLALFRLEFAELHTQVPQEMWLALQESARHHLRRAVVNEFRENELIGLEQYNRTDFVLLVGGTFDQEQGEGIPAGLCSNLDTIRICLEKGLTGDQPDWGRTLKVESAYVPLKSTVPFTSAERILSESYLSSLALATGKMTPQMDGLRNRMDQVLDRGEITVLAQPIMNLTTGDVFGWEILTRGPENTVLHYPDELFQFASQFQQLSRLEFMVVNHALQEVALRRIDEPVFLNVTAVTLSHPLFLAHVLQCLERHPALSPDKIYFEITERHPIANMEAMVEIVRKFRQLGFRFAVDDAGAGYSSLMWISELVPELIKIDRSVIRQVDQFAMKMSLLRAIVTAAREMNCAVVAEGVEREEEADVLFRLEVGMGQGYYFARPNVLLPEHERQMYEETKTRIQKRREQSAS